MKKKVLIVIVTFILVACGLAFAQHYANGNRVTTSQVNREILRLPKVGKSFTVFEFTYKEHDYLYFDGAGLVHNPVCHTCKYHQKYF